MSEIGLPADANHQQSNESRAAQQDQRAPTNLKNPHGIPTREYRSGSMNWFDTTTFLPDRDPLYVKNYTNNDISISSMTSIPAPNHSEERMTTRSHRLRDDSFDVALANSSVMYPGNDISHSDHVSLFIYYYYRYLYIYYYLYILLF